MAIQLFNTLSRHKEEFKPLSGTVGLYTCGPTVYNYPHIGNYRAYVFGDTLKRYLKYKGFVVKHVMNITDVDDKTIRDSQKEGVSLAAFTQRYEKAFMQDLKSLNIEAADIYPRATEHIAEMVGIIQKLLESGKAYKAEDGSIYYKVSAFDDYGKLAHLDRAALKEGASGRVKNDEYERESASDFALWKSWDAQDGDVFWETQIGKGRPGWHIECSAMSMKYLGESFDIHTGGVDLVFPHHQNEIAQSEGASGKPFVKYWLHNEWLLVDGKKMSKSLGNFYTLRDVLARGADPLAVRYLLLSVHYRQQLNFTFEGLDAAKNAIERLQEFVDKLRGIEKEEDWKEGTHEVIINAVKSAKKKFEEAMDDDLNTSNALAAIFDHIKGLNTPLDEGNIGKKTAKGVLDFLKQVNSVIGVLSFDEESVPQDILELVNQRDNARREKNFEAADNIRDELHQRGYRVDDTPHGTKVKRLK